jgi:hypothetical protein
LTLPPFSPDLPQILHLHPIRSGEGGESLLQDLDVPISHMWSPSFVPRCIDWPSHVDVVGDFTRLGDNNGGVARAAYQPDQRLQSFLDACEDMKPIYIGFGSMVIPNSEKLVTMIKVRRPILSAQEDGAHLRVGCCSRHWLPSHPPVWMD